MSHKRIGQIMSRTLISLASTATMEQASRLMSENRVSCLLVLDNSELKGILTEQDLVHALCSSSSARTHPVSDHMSAEVLAASEDMDIYEAFDFIRKYSIRHLVIRDEAGKMVGLVTLTDLAKATDVGDFLEFKQVASIMTPHPYTLSPDASVQQAVQIMDQHKVSCIIITDDELPVGIITERDIAALVHSEAFAASDPVSGYMHAPVVTISSDEVALKASSKMRKHRLRRLVVVDEGGNVCGVLTQYDVIKGLTGRYIEQLKRTIEDRDEKLKQAEQELANRALQDHLLQDTPVVHYAFACDHGNLEPLFATPNMLSLLGYSAEQFSWEWWRDGLHPGERDRVLTKLRDVVAGCDHRLTMEYRFRHADGHYIWLQDHLTIRRDASGAAIGVAGSWIDHSEHHQQLDELCKLQQAIDHAGEGIVLTNADGVVEYANPAYSMMSGYSQQECIGRKLSLFSDDVHHIRQQLKLWHERDSSRYWSGTLMRRRKGGESFPVMASVAPIYDHAGKISHYVSIQQDLSEHDELERKFYQAQKMEALGTLVGGIAHDFNNMLSGMLGNIFLVRQRLGESHSDLSDRLRLVEKSGYDAAAMIRKLLTFARKGEVEMSAVPLNAFIKEVFKLARLSVPESIKISIETAAEEICVRGDVTQLQQVMLNLISNASHAVEEHKQPQITIEISRVDYSKALHHQCPDLEAAHYACIRVSDNGCGINAELKEHIFEPFFTTKEQGKGTGLGLAMAFGAIQAHGGAIALDSTPGEGATFSIYLPLSDDQQTSQYIEEQPDLSGQQETILLADDEHAVRTITEEILHHLGYRVLHAENGQHCIEMFNSFKDEIDLVLTDIVMPEMNGIEAAKVIRSSSAELPIIFMTGYDRQHLDESIEASNALLLTKPVSIPELSSAIRSLIDANRQQA